MFPHSVRALLDWEHELLEGLDLRSGPDLPCQLAKFSTKTTTKEKEELTAEERRKLERKLKKESKKKEKQLMREAGISTKKVEPKKQSGSELALAYLTSWSENPEEWKFQKTRQTWLLLHMYDKEKVPDKYFTILLDYLQGLQGGARDITVQKAEAFMKEFDGSDAEDPDLLEKSAVPTFPPVLPITGQRTWSLASAS
ncbi:uncharacterized protein C7orf50 homolog [Tyto alba]|uniref:uncharacterized protein C7orf50 homolog n=1 Tax=Tyto alba TaxID=56313 RepID=UPI001C667B2E|nr:uncharacterized protein C7orf50 homolog [Tyto alba]